MTTQRRTAQENKLISLRCYDVRYDDILDKIFQGINEISDLQDGKCCYTYVASNEYYIDDMDEGEYILFNENAITTILEKYGYKSHIHRLLNKVQVYVTWN